VNTAEEHLVQRLVDRHSLDPLEAHAAVAGAQLGITDGPHAQLVADEARFALIEAYAAVGQRAAEVMRAIIGAFQPLAEAAVRAMQGLETVRSDTVAPPPRRARDRPAWQTPYGPPTRRHGPLSRLP